MKLKTLLCLLVLLPLAGCQIPQFNVGLQDAPWSPRAKLAAARVSFNAAMDVLITLREQGAFTEAQAKVASYYIEEGRRTLDRWQACINLEQPTDDFESQMAYVRREMETARLATEGGAS